MNIITNRTKLDGAKYLAKSNRIRIASDGSILLEIYYAGEDGKGYSHILTLQLNPGEASKIGSALLAATIRSTEEAKP